MTGNAAIYSSLPPPDSSFFESYPSAKNVRALLLPPMDLPRATRYILMAFTCSLSM